jgi:hypothetical protein
VIARAIQNTFPPDVMDAARAKTMDVTGKNGPGSAVCTCSSLADPTSKQGLKAVI